MLNLRRTRSIALTLFDFLGMSRPNIILTPTLAFLHFTSVFKLISLEVLWWRLKYHWRVPNPPGANPLVAERAPWRSSQSRVTGG